jgi:hypothetical protein
MSDWQNPYISGSGNFTNPDGSPFTEEQHLRYQRDAALDRFTVMMGVFDCIGEDPTLEKHRAVGSALIHQLADGGFEAVITEVRAMRPAPGEAKDDEAITPEII